jgi:hypothetical protein
VLREKDQNVKKSAISCIGELIFYIATQETQEEWTIPNTTVLTLSKCLKPGESEDVQEFAAQTIENVSGIVSYLTIVS